MAMKGIVLLESGPGRDALKKQCRRLKVPVDSFEALVEAELEQIGKLRKRGLWEKFDEIFQTSRCTSAQRSASRSRATSASRRL